MCKKCICTYLLPTSVHPRCWPAHTQFMECRAQLKFPKFPLKEKQRKKTHTPLPASKTRILLLTWMVTMWTWPNQTEAALTPPSSPLSFYFLKCYQNPCMTPPIKKNPGSWEFTDIRHISLYYVYKNAFIPTSDSACPIMPPCTWISYLPCEYLLLSSPIYASIFADAVVIGPQRSTLQWRLHLHRDVLYGITFFNEKNSMFVI